MNKLLYKTIIVSIFLLYLFSLTNSLLDKRKQCKCRISVQKRVVGGKEASSTSYPWVVALFRSGFKYPNWIKEFMNDQVKMSYFSCGGTILNERWILTAAHCVPQYDSYNEIKIGYGQRNDLIKLFDAPNNWVKRMIIHPNYHHESYPVDDVALLELERPIIFENSDAQPACLESISRKLYPDPITIVGYGAQDAAVFDLISGTRSRNNISRYLKENYISDRSDKFTACTKHESIICGDNTDFEASSCYGDSGTGIVYEDKNNGKAHVIGLVSGTDQYIQIDQFRFMCTGATYYMRISKYLDFIEKYIGKDYCT